MNSANAHLTKGSIEFLTIAIETCKFIESDKLNRNDLIDKLRKLLPLLYLKTAMVEPPRTVSYDEEPERFLSEKEYEQLRERLALLFGPLDQYLTANHPDIELSETPIVANISEDIADIYQSLKDFVAVGQIGNEALMSDALLICLNDFKNFWGSKLINALQALHLIWCQDKLNQNEPTTDNLNTF